MWRTLLAVILTSIPVLAQDPQPSELPRDYPEIRFSLNFTYHSLGLKLGHLLGVRRERPILSTYEGELMLGYGSSPETVVERQCRQEILQQGTSTRRTPAQDQEDLNKKVDAKCRLFDNPWRFSFLNFPLFTALSGMHDDPIVLYYVNYYIAPSHILMRTNNQLLAAFPVQQNLKIDNSYRIPSWSAVHPEAGTITGRVVQASVEYPLRKTYEIVIQESQNANNFRAMSVSDADMFVYIQRAMLTGRPMRIEFVRLYRPHGTLMSALFNYMTSLRVISVELL
jgi:hypothetical protein